MNPSCGPRPVRALVCLPACCPHPGRICPTSIPRFAPPPMHFTELVEARLELADARVLSRDRVQGGCLHGHGLVRGKTPAFERGDSSDRVIVRLSLRT